MPVAWFIAPYKRRTDAPRPTRYCAMDDHTPLIEADGGAWAETEVLGDRAIVKVRASAGTLAVINQAPGMVRVPLDRLDDSLGTLTAGQRAAVRNILTDAGYSLAEIQERLGSDLAQVTIGQALRFLASRRLKPRYDQGTDSIVLDGPAVPCLPVDRVDGMVA